MNKKLKRAVSVAVLLVTALVVSGCEGKVIKREPIGEGKYKIVYEREGNVERVEIVNKAVFEACTVGKKWPDCKSGLAEGMRNVPVNPPNRDEAQDKRNVQPRKPEAKKTTTNDKTRRICFKFISLPRVRITYRWATTTRTKGPYTEFLGAYSECTKAVVGSEVSMLVEHITQPSTVTCEIFVYREGVHDVIDIGTGSKLSDCSLSGKVPA